jgi:hypothetical protein
MAVYFVTGKLGAGKTLAAVSKIREYLNQGRKVATNLDIYLENVLPKKNKSTILRLPDKPRPEDLYNMGTGDGNHWEDNKTYDESKFGCLVLDECATWLNSRDYKDKERAEFLEYLLHARKYRWDIYFLVQDHKAIDKQIIEALCEHLVIVKRLDRVTIPMFTFWVSILTLGFVKMRLPKIHLALVYYGSGRSSMVTDRWFSYGSSLYSAYRTGQVFANDQMYYKDDFFDMRAPYTVLSPWHVKGRYYKGWKYKLLKLANRILNAVVRKQSIASPARLSAKRQETGTLQHNKKVSYLVHTICNEQKPERIPWTLKPQAI